MLHGYQYDDPVDSAYDRLAGPEDAFTVLDGVPKQH